MNAPATSSSEPIAARVEEPQVSERLARALEAHAAAEAQSLADYERLASLDGDPIARILMGVVMQDERQHHQLLARMASSLHEEMAGGGELPANGVDEDVLHVTRSLIREEREGARYLRHLARQEPGAFQGLYAVLLESMARDSEKHERILRFLLHRFETRES